jgi:hypothetical protein
MTPKSFSKLCTLAGLMLALMATASQAQPASNPELLFTEIDSTHLTATLDGITDGTVNFTSPDHWNWLSGFQAQIPAAIFHTGSFIWAEPGAEPGFNFAGVAFLDSPGGGHQFGLNLSSDSLLPLTGANANGGFGGTLTARDSTGLVFEYDVYFVDLGDAASSVPDASSTAGMLILSTGALFGVARRIASGHAFQPGWWYGLNPGALP